MGVLKPAAALSHLHVVDGAVHPGDIDVAAGQKRYAIISYEAAGHGWYWLTKSSLTMTILSTLPGAEIVVLVSIGRRHPLHVALNTTLMAPRQQSSNSQTKASVTFDTELGWLDKGGRVFVCVGSVGTRGLGPSAGLALDFGLSRTLGHSDATLATSTTTISGCNGTRDPRIPCDSLRKGKDTFCENPGLKATCTAPSSPPCAQGCDLS